MSAQRHPDALLARPGWRQETTNLDCQVKEDRDSETGVNMYKPCLALKESQVASHGFKEKQQANQCTRASQKIPIDGPPERSGQDPWTMAFPW